jgi:hypothetical protein
MYPEKNVKLIKIKGTYTEAGKIELESHKIIQWNELSDLKLPELPNGIKIELNISFEEDDFLFGMNGIVWATYDLRQAEIIQNAMLAQHINSEIKKIDLVEKQILLISITNATDVYDAIDFIWKSNSGLRLKPDWNYTEDERNESFEQWLSGQ